MISFFDSFTVEITNKEADSDRNIYMESPIRWNKEHYLSELGHGMADMGFAGDVDIVVPYKQNESTEWIFRGSHGRNIRSQRIVNELVIDYINNNYKIFLDRWPFD